MANTIVKLPDDLKFSLIYGENLEEDDASQGEIQRQRLNEKTPKVFAQRERINYCFPEGDVIVRPLAITKRNQ